MKRTVKTIIKNWFGSPRTSIAAAVCLSGLIMFWLNIIPIAGLVTMVTLGSVAIGFSAKDSTPSNTTEITQETKIETEI